MPKSAEIRKFILSKNAEIRKSFFAKMRKIAKCLICKLEKERNVYVLSTWRDGYQLLPACGVFQKKVFRAPIVPKIYCSCVWSLYYCMRIKKGRYLRTTLNVYTTE